MASDFIAIDPGQIAKLAGIINKLPPEVGAACTRAVSEYLINVYKLYPPYKHVSRSAAYGKTWANDAQRKAVMAKLRESGDLVDGVYTPRPHRTQNLARKWQTIGEGINIIVANETPYAAHVMGEGEQANMMTLIGWKTTDAIAQERAPRIDRIIDGEAERALNKLARQV